MIPIISIAIIVATAYAAGSLKAMLTMVYVKQFGECPAKPIGVILTIASFAVLILLYMLVIAISFLADGELAQGMIMLIGVVICILLPFVGAFLFKKYLLTESELEIIESVIDSPRLENDDEDEPN